MVAHPGDRFVEPFLERIMRFPAPEALRQRRAGEQSLDLAGGGAVPFLIGLDGDRSAQPAADHLDQVADRDIFAAADIDGPAQRRVAAGDGDEPCDGVLDVGQVAARVEPAQPDGRLEPAPG